MGEGEQFPFGSPAGNVICLDATSGEELWGESYDDRFYSSPVVAGYRLFILDVLGNMYLPRARAEFELIAKTPMGEPTFATPAFGDGRK